MWPTKSKNSFNLKDIKPKANFQWYKIGLLSFAFTGFSTQACNQKLNQQKMNLTVNEEKLDTAVLGGGCFWCLDAVYREMEGIVTVNSGYSNGKVKKPTYREVCTGNTQCVEVVEIIYDTEKTSYEEILTVFWRIHNPTTLNRQGNDIGTQYRSGIYYLNDAQKDLAVKSKEAVEESKLWEGKIVTEILPLKDFSVAEDYHQNYFQNNPNQPYCTYVVGEKVEKFRKLFAEKRKK
jgi:peptide-methionine (S)-S-oxide reductase